MAELQRRWFDAGRRSPGPQQRVVHQRAVGREHCELGRVGAPEHAEVVDIVIRVATVVGEKHPLLAPAPNTQRRRGDGRKVPVGSVEPQVGDWLCDLW